MEAAGPARPFPESLCHTCAAPPRYVVSDRGSVFIHCPVLQLYPPQPPGQQYPPQQYPPQQPPGQQYPPQQ